MDESTKLWNKPMIELTLADTAKIYAGALVLSAGFITVVALGGSVKAKIQNRVAARKSNKAE